MRRSRTAHIERSRPAGDGTSPYISLRAARLRTSARNCLAGTVVRRERGAVNDEIVLEIDEGKTITATITSTSADALGLDVGALAQALIKAPHVILAVD